MRATEDHTKRASRQGWGSRIAVTSMVGCLSCVLLLAASGCAGGSKGAGQGSGQGSAEASKTGAHMAGPATDVYITEAAVRAVPLPPVFTSPQSAVRSYLNWTAYAYRIGQSKVASRTMSADESVRVDSYIQYNIQQKRLMQEELTFLRLGKPRVGTTSTVVPAEERWTYSYLSIEQGNKVVGGPYTIGYDARYTVIKRKNGEWVVDSVKATPRGTVK